MIKSSLLEFNIVPFVVTKGWFTPFEYFLSKFDESTNMNILGSAKSNCV